MKLRLLPTLGLSLLLGACAHGPGTYAPAAGAAAVPASSKAPAAAASGEIKSLLWVGNSFFYFNNSMHSHVEQMLRAAGGQGYRGVSVTISGSGLSWHDLEAYFQPGMASYSFVGNNELVFNQSDKPFDAVLMVDCSQCPMHPKLATLFHEQVQKKSAAARAHGAQPFLFMSWAYQDKPDMTAPLAAAYARAGRENQVRVVPAGLAFAESIKRRPDLNLYQPDKRHPSLAGTYLGAATVLAAVYGRNPVGNAYNAGLPAEVAAHLQAVAWDTVQAFETQQGQRRAAP